MCGALPACLRGERVLKRGGGLLDNRRELLGNCSGNQTMNDVTNDNTKDATVGFLKRCEAAQSDGVDHFVRDHSTGEVLCQPPETHGVLFALQQRPKMVSRHPRWPSSCSSACDPQILRKSIVVKREQPLATPPAKIVTEWFTGHWWASRLVRQRTLSGLVPRCEGSAFEGRTSSREFAHLHQRPVRVAPVCATHPPVVGDDDVGTRTEALGCKNLTSLQEMEPTASGKIRETFEDPALGHVAGPRGKAVEQQTRKEKKELPSPGDGDSIANIARPVCPRSKRVSLKLCTTHRKKGWKTLDHACLGEKRILEVHAVQNRPKLSELQLQKTTEETGTSTSSSENQHRPLNQHLTEGRQRSQPPPENRIRD